MRKTLFTKFTIISELQPSQWFTIHKDTLREKIFYLHIFLLMTVNMLYQLRVLERMNSRNEQQEEG